MRKVYEALNSKLAKAIICSILGLYIIYLLILTLASKDPLNYMLIYNSIFIPSFLSSYSLFTFAAEQTFIISLVLLFTLINLLTDKFDDHEIIRSSLLFGAFWVFFVIFGIYAPRYGFAGEEFTQFARVVPVIIINGLLVLFTIFKMVLSFIYRKIVFHRFFIEYGCFVIGIVFSGLLFSIPVVYAYEGESDSYSYWFFYAFYGLFDGLIFWFFSEGALCPVIVHGMIITTVFAFALMIVRIVKSVRKKAIKTKQPKILHNTD